MTQDTKLLDDAMASRDVMSSITAASDYLPVLSGGVLKRALGTVIAAGLAAAVGTSLIASSITNGDTTHAPSGDVVYDALVLKADQSTLAGYYTSSQTDTLLAAKLSIASAAATYQPLASALTSWAAITRASGFDTFTATPSGANLASLLTTALPVSKGGTNATSAGIAAFNNITGYTAAGATGTTSTNLVFSTSPTLVTPVLGAATATSINGLAITSSTGTLTITNAKTLSLSNTLTFAGTDGTTITFQGTGTYVSRDSTDTLLNKTLTAPVMTSPTLGVATATSVNGLTITTTTGTITITNGKTLSVSNTITFTATDGSTLAIGTGGTLASAAYKATGTSGNTVPLLDGANTFSALQIMSRAGFPLQLANSSGAGYLVALHGSNALDAYLYTSATVFEVQNASAATRLSLNLSTGALTLAGIAVPTISSTDTLTNKTITAPVMSGTWTGTPTFSGAVTFTACPSVSGITGSNQIALSLTSSAGAFLQFTDQGNLDIALGVPDGGAGLSVYNNRNPSAAGTENSRFTNGGGFMVGAPTGGDQGAGKINAVGVYDDSVLLTCFVIEYARTGKIDLTFWDSMSPTGKHDAAHRFWEQRHYLDPDAYSSFWHETGHLPGLPSREEWKDHGRDKKTLGDMVSRLWQTAEMQAVHIDQLSQRIKELEIA